MLEYLAYYALFAVLMTGCLLYVMSALETKEIPLPKQEDSRLIVQAAKGAFWSMC